MDVKKKSLETEFGNKNWFESNSYNNNLHLHNEGLVSKSLSHMLFYLPVALALSPDGCFQTIAT